MRAGRLCATLAFLPAFIVMMVAVQAVGWSLRQRNPMPLWRYLCGR